MLYETNNKKPIIASRLIQSTWIPHLSIRITNLHRKEFLVLDETRTVELQGGKKKEAKKPECAPSGDVERASLRGFGGEQRAGRRSYYCAHYVHSRESQDVFTLGGVAVQLDQI